MKALALTLGLLALAAAPAAAQYDETGYMFAIGGGLTAGVGDLADSTDPSYTFGGFLSGPMAGSIGWRLEGSYDHFKASDDVDNLCDALGIDCDQRILHFGGGLQFTGRGDQVNPYAYATIGAYSSRVEESGSDSETDWGLGLGGGVNWRAGDSWGVTLDLGFHGINDLLIDEDGDSSWGWYMTPRAYVSFLF